MAKSFFLVQSNDFASHGFLSATGHLYNTIPISRDKNSAPFIKDKAQDAKKLRKK
jgi:hypothetical protein